MLRRFHLFGAVLIMAACGCTATKPRPAGVDNLLRRAVETRRVPGVVAMVATAEGVAYEGAFGFNKDAIFAIASMTKPVTSVAVMQLVEAGKVNPDDPAARYLPELATVQVLEAGKLRAPATPVTVRQLLTHTSGFGYEFLNRELSEYVAQGKAPSVFTGSVESLKAPLVSDPGKSWEYGISTDWLGRLVEKVSGQSLEAYLRRNLFEPLGMRDTYFDVPPEKEARRVAVHQRAGNGSLAEQPRAPAKPAAFLSGGGGLSSTAPDYLKFAQALMAGGRLGQARILRPQSVATMGRNQIGALECCPFSSLMPQLIKDGTELPGGLDKFGLGFAVNTRPLGRGRGANTLSWAGVFNTFFWIDRDRRVCAVLMSQMAPFLDDGPRALLEDFDRAVYDWLR